MRKSTVILIIFLFLKTTIHSQNPEADISNRVFIVGNTSDLVSPGDLENLKKAIQQETTPATVIYCGDILHSNGLESTPDATDSTYIRNLLSITEDKSDVAVYFLPGDLDWNNSGKEGLQSVKRIENLVNGIAGKKIFLPGSGCPGPEVIIPSEDLELVFLNTQWLIHPYDRPYAPDANCNIIVEAQFMEELEGIIEDAKEKNLLIVGHHPVISNGAYGGKVSLRQHIIPPVIGTFISSYQQNIGTPKHIAYPPYKEFAGKMKTLMNDYTPFVYASAHEFNLQLMNYENSYQVISGSFVKKFPAGKSANTVFHSNEKGFVCLNYFKNGKITMTSYFSDKAIKRSTLSTELYQSYCSPDSSGAPVNTRFVPCAEKIVAAEHMNPAFNDSIAIAVGGPEYKAGFFRKLFLGRLYRSSWTAEIKVPFLNLDTTKGGLVATGRGGGRQTHSLSLSGADGKSYVFRSVDKDPIKALDPFLRKTFVVGLTRQFTATQNPYGAMPVKYLLDSTSILHAQPVLHILPNDPKLGIFQKEYGGMLGMLEEKPKKGNSKQIGSFGANDVVRSFDLFKKMYRDNDNRMDEVAFLRARIFDMWIGDWGRHEDNWKWAGFKNGKKTTYLPIPRDRDHAFSRWNGILPYLTSRRWALPNAENFGYHFEDIRSLTYTSRYLDRFLLTSLDKNEWVQLTAELQNKMSDQLIDNAIQQFPKEIIPLSGQVIGEKLKSRKAELPRAMTEYYLLLAKNVNVVGSNQSEYFKIERLNNSDVDVSMYDYSKTGQPGDSALYHRIFKADETKSVNVYGLDGDDKIFLTGAADQSILVRVFGGKGNDSISDHSSLSSNKKITRIYDYNSQDKNTIVTGKNTKTIFSDDRSLVEFNRQDFHYNTYLPMPFLNYSAEDGFTLGLGLQFLFHRFGEKDYHNKLSLSGKASTEGNIQFKVADEFHHVLSNWDWIINGEVAQPYPVIYFYGAGNETVKLTNVSSDFYKSRFNGYNISTGLQHIFWKKSSVNVTLGYESNDAVISSDNLLSLNAADANADIFGSNQLDFFKAQVSFDMDFRDNTSLPKHGARFFTQHYAAHFNISDNKDFTNSIASIEIYQTTRTLIPITLGVKAEGAHATGDIPFYKLNSIGRTNGLHGYDRNRFSGKSSLYIDSQLSVEFGRLSTFFVPLTVGIFGFYDVGRVWVPGETSSKLHSGYGGGVYFTPLLDVFTTRLSMAFSDEVKKGIFEFGLGLNF